MRVVFAGLLQENAIFFEAIMQDLPDCDGVFCADLAAAWHECLESEPDLMLVDALTPSGLALVEKFHAHYADIPVLMIIGQEDRLLKLQALKSGASDFLSSPPEELECLVRIRNLLALRKSRHELVKRTAWLADEVNEAYQAMALNATQAQEISEIAEANLQLEQANRNKNDTLAHISHDLRAPLTTILGYTELLSTDEPLVSHTRDVISRNAHHVLGLIDELLEFARNTIGHRQSQPETVNLQALIEHVIQQVRVCAYGNCVTQELIGRLPQALVIDGMAVKRVLSNLLGNAAKFTRNGTVTLRVSSQGDDLRQQTVLFEVIDSGAGIAAEALAHIFEPFYRAAPMSVSGAGLGLAICRQLAAAMGARITVESAPGKGSCFSLQLTCPVVYEEVPVAVGAESGEIDGAGRLIMLVEDQDEVRHYLTAKFNRAGFRIISAENGRAALDALATCQEMPVAVVTDQAMPEMDGWALLKVLRAQYGAGLPVLLHSSAAPYPPDNWNDQLRFDAVLLRSADPGALLNVLCRQLSQSAADLEGFADIAAPDEEQLIKFDYWAGQGALSMLEVQAQKLAEVCPEYAGFADFVLARCAALDVEGVTGFCRAQRLRQRRL